MLSARITCTLLVATAAFAHVGGSPDYSLIEGYVTPWDGLDWRGSDRSLRSELHAGKVIGLQFTLADFDSAPGEYEGFQTVAGAGNSCCTASHFIDAMLLCDDGDCEPDPVSSVQADSWARIKASLR
ncbi:MAG: hypothetical protein QF689_13845 [Candidatus Latescibacteria bacterium]|nr:hypothetical protein [Gemmatimonadaceae bacterium]MDP6016089.1 hypothetical protein [Candidatus Latescibacterota bacterium]MDP7449670.1 hypothetical protein [Candidatus Latescibacterota bacterium]HJP31012.1 hypothetical protein [Candidatus Latescibacterota bacterium]